LKSSNALYVVHLEVESTRYREFTANRRTASFDPQYDFTTNKLRPRRRCRSSSRLYVIEQPLHSKFPIAQFAHALVTEYETGAALGWHRDAMQFGIVVGNSWRPTRGCSCVHIRLVTTNAEV
ncbi:MAG: hypothetical protein ABI612_04860, partial [Betaproteobacteria bacterium]